MKSILNDVFCDNGEFSHYQIIDSDTGVILWSEAEDEQKIVEQNKTVIEEKKRVALLQKVVERINGHVREEHGIVLGINKELRNIILETKLEE
jgi:hypothetical protein